MGSTPIFDTSQPATKTKRLKIRKGITLKKRTVIVTMCIAVAALAVSAGAFAALSGPERPELASIDQLQVFRSSQRPGSADLAAIKKYAAVAPPASLLARVEPASARKAGADNFSAWVAKTENGGACVFVPSGAGYGTACASLEEFNQIGLSAVGLSTNGDYVVVSVQPPGIATFVENASTHKAREVPPENGVSVATVTTAEIVRVGSEAIAVGELDKQRKAAEESIRAELGR